MGNTNSPKSSFLQNINLNNPLSETEAKCIWDKFDTNRSGTLEENEIKNLIAEYIKIKKITVDHGKILDAFMHTFDANCDGIISFDEITRNYNHDLQENHFMTDTSSRGLTRTKKKKVTLHSPVDSPILSSGKGSPRLFSPRLGISRSNSTNSMTSENFFDSQELFNQLCDDYCMVDPSTLIDAIGSVGLTLDDPRLRESKRRLNKFVLNCEKLHLSDFARVISPATSLVEKTMSKDGCQLVIPNWEEFRNRIDDMFHKAKQITTGNVYQSIPELKGANPDLYSMAFCSIDGQMYQCGDQNSLFTLQTAAKPINYLAALKEHGPEEVHRFVGREPTGRNMEKLGLNEENIPHNPFVESGAIITCSLIKHDYEDSDRFAHIMKLWKQATGDDTLLGFSNAAYLSRRSIAARNFCLGYMLQEKGALQHGKDKSRPRKWKGHSSLVSVVELLSMCYSIQLDVVALSRVASTLANGGICPTTGKRVFNAEHVRATLSLMLSCGMYEFSGHWMYSCGVPACSGLSGVIMVVIPNLGGFAVYSPRVDKHNNSCRGLEFFRLFVQTYTVHIMEVVTEMNQKDEGDEEDKDDKVCELTNTGIENQNDIDLWSSEDVKRWICALGVDFEEYGEFVEINHVDGLYLVDFKECDIDHLEDDFGISDKSHKQVIFAEIQKLQLEYNKKNIIFEKQRKYAHKNSMLSNKCLMKKINLFKSKNGRGKYQMDIIIVIFMAAAGDLDGIISAYAAGIDLNACDYDARTALHLAACEGHLEVCKYLVSHDADVNAIDRLGGTPLLDAQEHGSSEVVEFLKSVGATVPQEISTHQITTPSNAMYQDIVEEQDQDQKN